MQTMTMESQAQMPVCLQEPLADGSLQLSTVHEPVGELSFYAQIHQQGQAWRKEWRSYQMFTTQFVMLKLDETPVMHAVETRAAEIVSRAKRVTGLSIKDLASVFGVTRQTLYNYRKNQERISERNWLRLEAVDREVKQLSMILHSSPGSLSKHFVFEGETLHDLLCASILDTSKIQRLATVLAEQLSPARQAKIRHAASIDQLTRHG